MTEHCPDCHRPYSADACEGCHRSKRGAWPVTALGMGVGKGGPGAARGPQGNRAHVISVRMDADLTARVMALAESRGHPVGRVIRDLLGVGLERDRPPSGLTDAKRAQLRELSKPGTEPRRPPERLRPVHEFGPFER